MSDVERREFLAGAAGLAASAILLATRTAGAGDPTFMNNVPDPLVSGKDLPTFKFALEKSEGKVVGKSSALAQCAAVYSGIWAAESCNASVRLRATIDQLQQEVALLQKEICVK
jgi:hypothetical protein